MRTTRSIAVIGLVIAIAGCEVIADIHEGKPFPNDAGTPDTSEECENQPEGTAIAEQMPGDCVEVVCNGAGSTKIVLVATDVSDDSNPCTLDECIGSEPMHTVQMQIACYTGSADTQGVGECKAGMQQCDAQGNLVGTCEGEVLPTEENCVSSGDEDCDGQANEDGNGCECTPGEVDPCYTGPVGTENAGICHEGMQSCNADGLGYGPCAGEQTPQTEDCDAMQLDEDCDGQINEEGPNCICGDGFVSTGEQCDDSNADSTDGCTALCKLPACGDGFVQPGADETCDDGGTSDGDACSPTCNEQRVLEVVGGAGHICARLSGGKVKCWGVNTFGQLGLGDILARGDEANEMGDKLASVDLGTGKTAVMIAAGNAHTCALLNDSTVKCWGLNEYGQLGLGDMQSRGSKPNEMGDNLPPVDLGTGKMAIAIDTGYAHTCALLNDGSIKCWGGNNYGQLGIGNTQNRGDGPNEVGDNLVPVDLGTGQTAIIIDAGQTHMCALLNGGTVKCWGEGSNGQLGQGATQDRGDEPNELGNNLNPVDLGAGKTATAIAATYRHTCALLNDGTIKCWGGNNYGQLGLGDTQGRGDDPNEMGDYLAPLDLGGSGIATAIATAFTHTCALLNGGVVKCWGYNFYGQLGQGDIQNRGDGPNEMGNNLVAVNLGTGKTATSIAAGRYHNTCALLSDGSVKCWGENTFGQLGLGDKQHRGDMPGEMGDALPTVKLFTDLW